MKKGIFILILLCGVISIKAQNYQIKFTGTGASSNVNQIKIENLTQQTSLTISGTDILLLKQYVTGIDEATQIEKGKLHIYPNPTNDFTYLEFSLPASGQTHIEVIDISGRSIKKFSEFLNSGIHKIKLEGLENGLYLVKISSINFMSSAKLINNKKKTGVSSLISLKVISKDLSVENIKSATSNIEMQYNDGDRLKFTGISGNYKTVFMDTPSSSKTISFEFIPCIDPDGRGYEIVKIGNQWWMAENLAYLPLVCKLSDNNTAYKRFYVLKYDGTNIEEAKSTTTYAKYGVLYNWPAAMNEQMSVNSNILKIQGICPTGWHLPKDEEWEALANYINSTKGPFSKSNDDWEKIGYYLKSISGWYHETNGNDEYGFNGLPSGYKSYYTFSDNNIVGQWWSSSYKYLTSPYYRGVDYFNGKFSNQASSSAGGESVRCIKD
jgi:uncharacterized protein (TIGR02145 family)